MKTKEDKLAYAIMGLGILTIAINEKGYEVKIVKKEKLKSKIQGEVLDS